MTQQTTKTSTIKPFAEIKNDIQYFFNFQCENKPSGKVWGKGLDILRSVLREPSLQANYETQSYGTVFINCDPTHNKKGARLGSAGNDFVDSFKNLYEAAIMWEGIDLLPD